MPRARAPCRSGRVAGLSETNFRTNVLPYVRSIKVGRARIVPVIELERWLHLNGRITDEE